jgi:hypothetical protein
MSGCQSASPAELIEELLRGDEDRCAAEPPLERAVEERIGSAVHEGHDRPTLQIHAELGLGREVALSRERPPDEVLELARADHLHGASFQ